jgi:hypothetical protein
VIEIFVDPLVPEIVSEDDPAGVVLAVATVNNDVAPVPGLTLAGEKTAVAPLGSPLALSDTDPVNPFAAARVTVKFAVWPCWIDWLVGDTPRENVGLLGAASTTPATANNADETASTVRTMFLILVACLIALPLSPR